MQRDGDDLTEVDGALLIALWLNGRHLRFARVCRYVPAMSDREFWTKKLKEAERELDVARTRTAPDAAAKRFMLAEQELKRLQAEVSV